jgi:hypothetical protein
MDANSDQAKRKRTSQFRALLVFLFIGLLVLGVGWFLINRLPKEMKEVDKYWATTFQGLAFTLGTVAIVGLVWRFLGGDPVDEALTDLGKATDRTKAVVEDLEKNFGALKAAQDDLINSVKLTEQIRKTGIEHLHAQSTYVGGWMVRLGSAQKQVDLMGYALQKWIETPGFEKGLEEKVRSGVQIRVLIMDVDNERLEAILNLKISQFIVPQTKRSVQQTMELMKRVADKLQKGAPLQGSFEFRTLREGTILTQLCRTDARLTALQYLYSAHASGSPLLEVSGEDSELFKVYMDEFKMLWDAGETVAAFPPKSVPSSHARQN